MRPRLLLIAVSLLLAAAGASAQDRLYSNAFPLGDVKLLDGPLKTARDLNLEVLMQYDVDRMLAPYRKEAGLQMKAKPYPNWDGLDGHIAGHYLSAMAQNYAATGDKECRERMEYMLSELKEVHAAHAKNHPEWGVDYIGGFPGSDELWTSFKKGEFGIYFAAWAPFYNLHKMYAGLRDAWVYCGYEDAKDMFLAFSDWAINLTSGLTQEQMQAMMRNEQGGMNEVLADAYAVSGDKKYLDAARRFSHNQILDPLSEGVDCLDNMHANTQVPKALGFVRIGDLSGDAKYLDAGRFFWETVTGTRSLAFGGNSRREHFPPAEAYIDFLNDNDGPESCNTYNMLKLTENLFRLAPSSAYSDYYERALFNHILSTQHPEHGGYVYFTGVRPRHYRVYSAAGEAMWCCVGTGMENHGKYGQFIYTHDDNSLYVNLFVASELDWKEHRMVLRQETAFPYGETSRIVVAKGKGQFELKVRKPSWVADGKFAVTVNGKDVSAQADADGYVSVDRKWKKGDVVEVAFPMHTSVVPLPNVPQYVAFMHGPIVLGMKTGTEDLRGIIADDSRFGQYAGGEYLPVDKAPMLLYGEADLADCLKPVPGKPLHFTFEGVEVRNPIEGELQPFYTIHDARYMMYWLALSKDGYEEYLAALAAEEAAKLKLEGRTADHVQPAEQQPETDHKMQFERSTTGNTNNVFFREAQNGGWFSYELATQGKTELSLYVKYWGVDDWGTRRFDIMIDDEKLIEVNNSRRWRSSVFKTEEYRIPASMLEGKEYIRVRFQSYPGTQVGGLYELRLVESQPTVAVLGDSYSTFLGHIPDGNAWWYSSRPQGPNDVVKVEDTWWNQFCSIAGYDLVMNESWSGSTICNTGYDAVPCPTWSFIARMKNIVAGEEDPDLILICGGTNDSWANSPIGEMKYADWTSEDLASYLPACCYMLDYLRREAPDAEIVCVVNSELKPEITQGQFDACEHYGAHALLLEDIEKIWNHPSVAGMTAMAEQVAAFVEKL